MPNTNYSTEWAIETLSLALRELSVFELPNIGTFRLELVPATIVPETQSVKAPGFCWAFTPNPTAQPESLASYLRVRHTMNQAEATEAAQALALRVAELLLEAKQVAFPQAGLLWLDENGELCWTPEVLELHPPIPAESLLTQALQAASQNPVGGEAEKNRFTLRNALLFLSFLVVIGGGIWFMYTRGESGAISNSTQTTEQQTPPNTPNAANPKPQAPDSLKVDSIPQTESLPEQSLSQRPLPYSLHEYHIVMAMLKSPADYSDRVTELITAGVAVVDTFPCAGGTCVSVWRHPDSAAVATKLAELKATGYIPNSSTIQKVSR